MSEPTFSERIAALEINTAVICTPKEAEFYRYGCDNVKRVAGNIAAEADARIAELEAQLAAEHAGVIVPRLTWKKGVWSHHESVTPFGVFCVNVHSDCAFWRFESYGTPTSYEVESFEAAKTACEAHWQATMRAALRRMPSGRQHDKNRATPCG
jgi:hypothetical protein